MVFTIRIDLSGVMTPIRLLARPIAAHWNRFMETSMNPLADDDLVLKYAMRRANRKDTQ